MPITLGRFGRPKPTLFTENEKKNQEKIILPSLSVTRMNPSEPSEDIDKFSIVLDWLSICLTEEHIEPSQPKVGSICGWPQRAFPCESLYVDFACWCSKKDLAPCEQASGRLFYSIVDKILTRQGEKYHFPPVDECRLKFNDLTKILKRR